MADKMIVSREKLVAVADAVREKTGGTESLTLDEMPGAIAGIKGGDTLADRLNDAMKDYFSEEVTKIGNYAFWQCSSLENIECPKCVTIKTASFQNCKSLKTVNFPLCTSIGSTVFRGCASLAQINLPVCASTSTYCFAECSSLQRVAFPSMRTVAGAAFQSCTSLEYVYLPNAVSIGAMCFQYCSALQTVIIEQTATVTSMAATTAFAGTPIAEGTGYIYVPAAQVDKYRAATNWTTYASQIRAIEDYPEITGG